MHVNMHTVNSISFTRGFVLKKHLVPRKEINTQLSQEKEKEKEKEKS